MGALNLVSLMLFTIESFALYVPMYHHLKIDTAEKYNFTFRENKWVVLVAGSSGWSNYRHQADICHAYQIIRENGIPEKNIITMMVDDIAYNPRNPTPGKIINSPNGPDVYNGVVIDYKGADVNKVNFLNIITGEKEAMRSIGTGKVVEARGLFDKIFINFVDHGTTGLLTFPNECLYADELNSAINNITSGSFRKVLLYIEACKSGSMFNGILSENKSALALTAAGPRENSYGCYCRSQSGPYDTCLGDLFSVTWLEDLDETVFDSYAIRKTIFNDFNIIRTNVTRSSVMIYGDMTIGHEKLSSFIGNRPKSTQMSKNLKERITYSDKVTVSSRDVHKNIIQHKLLAKDKLTALDKQILEVEFRLNYEMRFVIDKVFRTIYSKVVKTRPDIRDKIGEFDEQKFLVLRLDIFPCYRNILNEITERCFSLPQNPYSLDRLTIFANLCVVDKKIHQIISKFIGETCLHIPKHIHNVY